jgi:hypothetical protein
MPAVGATQMLGDHDPGAPDAPQRKVLFAALLAVLSALVLIMGLILYVQSR